MAEGRGNARKRIKVQVDVQGDIQPPLDQDEMNAADMPPPFMFFPKVKKDKVKQAQLS